MEQSAARVLGVARAAGKAPATAGTRREAQPRAAMGAAPEPPLALAQAAPAAAGQRVPATGGTSNGGTLGANASGRAAGAAAAGWRAMPEPLTFSTFSAGSFPTMEGRPRWSPPD